MAGGCPISGFRKYFRAFAQPFTFNAGLIRGSFPESRRSGRSRQWPEIPLVCSPWEDAENLFTPGADYLVADNGGEMVKHLQRILNDGKTGPSLAAHALETVRSRHPCARREIGRA